MTLETDGYDASEYASLGCGFLVTVAAIAICLWIASATSGVVRVFFFVLATISTALLIAGLIGGAVHLIRRR